jgi:selenobiotic family peptide radical SAM maturase
MLRDRERIGRRAPAFTLQWHLTNACNAHCRHCYDRAPRPTLPFDEAVAVLDDLGRFCRRHRVCGQVSLTGGDPMLYPHFWQLYEEIARRGHGISVLGLPVPEADVARLAAIQPPDYYQVSLEGLREYNDGVRGSGSYARTINFLSILHDHSIPGGVMLTLSRENLGEVVPLARELAGRVNGFNFTRLSQAGSGRNIAQPTRMDYLAFLREYMAAARTMRHMRFKDNLISIVRHHRGEPLQHGCSGFGCGAAFNFVALLPDGEVHACRKFPSPLGNLHQRTLAEIYESALAKRYRRGPRACRHCVLRPVCGGCLAVTWSAGGDFFADRDPHCFMADRKRLLAGF